MNIPPPPPQQLPQYPRWNPFLGLTMFQFCLGICGCTIAHAVAIEREGYDTLDSFANIRFKEVREMAKNALKFPNNVAGGPIHIGAVQVRNLEALWQWCFRQRCYGLPLDASGFDPQVLAEFLQEMQIDEANESADKAAADAVKDPGPFKGTAYGWIQWELAFTNYLRSKPSKQRVPLAYVVRRDTMPNNPDDITRRMYMVRLNGPLYDIDNARVYQLLKSFTLKTEGWEWMKNYDTTENGRGAMLALRAHYDGSAAISRRVAYANQIIKDAHYRTEQTYPFEQFITKLNGAFQILADNDQPKSEKQKIDDMISSIQSTHAAIQTMIQVIRMSEEYANNFILAANKMSEAIACTFPSTGTGRGRNISQVNSNSTHRNTGRGGTSGRGRGNGGRGGRGRGGRGRGGRSTGRGGNTNNSNNPNRYIDNQEWFSMTPQQRQEILAARSNQGTNNRNTSAMSNTNDQREDLSTITQDDDNNNEANNSSTPRSNSSGTTRNSSSAFGRDSHNGNRNQRQRTSALISSTRNVDARDTSKVKAYTDYVSNIEMDNHADTHCFGKNFTPILWTSEKCNVSGFTSTMPAIESVPICTACTAYDDPVTGATIILEFPQGLWLGEHMNHSLINPNQCRAFGVMICDDPFDPNRSLSISHPDHHCSIPLRLQGPNVVLTTRAPSLEEINTSPYRLVMNDEWWDPTKLSDIQLPVIANDTHNVGKVSIESSRVDTFVQDMINARNITHEQAISMATSERHSVISPENLATKWSIPLDTARKTLKATTQFGVRHATQPLRKRYRTDILLSRYRRFNTTMYSDTIFFKYKSLNSNTVAQIFCNEDIIQVYPMASKANAGQALREFISDIGVPTHLVVDGAQEQVGKNTEFGQLTRKHHIDLRTTEAYTPRQNRAEYYVGEIKRRWRQLVSQRKISPRLWNYGIRWLAEIMSRTAKGTDDRTGMERFTGDTPDISEWIDFKFYDLVWYWDSPWSKEDDKKACLGRWLGVSHRIGSNMCYYVLTATGKVLSRTTVQHVPLIELDDLDVKMQITKLTEGIVSALNDPNHMIKVSPGSVIEYVEDTPVDDELVEDIVSHADIHHTPEAFDTYLNAEAFLPYQGEWRKGTVLKRVAGEDGNPIGTRHSNPILDTRRYVVEFPDGVRQEYTANTIAENIFAQCDPEGRQHLLFNGIADHRINDDAVKDDEGFILSKNGNKVPKRTTKGWDLLIEWKDGTTSWVPLKQVKDSNPVELAEYAAAHKLLNKPVFNWWAKWTLNKRDRIINKVKSRYWKTTHKFGIRIPKTVEEALRIDRETGTTFWTDAIDKEMRHVLPAFCITDFTLEQIKSGKVLIGYQLIKCHMIFDVKIEGLIRKARFVAGGHMTDAPESITYSSVVSRDSVRIAFLYAALNGLSLWAADVTNAYLNAKAREKIYCIAGPEFGSNSGKIVVIEMALYGLKSSGAAWREHLATNLINLNFKNTIADPDVWIRATINPANNLEYYEMVLVYVDDILYVGHDPEKMMGTLGQIYKLKEGSVGPPTRYLGANIKLYTLPDGSEAWSMSARDYVKTVVKNVEQVLGNVGEKLKSGIKTPLPTNYKPELDVTHLLEPSEVNYYQQLIGILRWTCELGRVDILLEVSLMSSYCANPRVGHMEAIYHIFSYLKNHENSTLVFDSSEPDFDPNVFVPDQDWHGFYLDAKDVCPPNMPPPKGKSVTISCFVDANHAGNLITRRSQTGFIIFVNKSPIIWYSKRQNTVESSSFGSEFNALRIASEAIEALRYKLRMFGIEIQGPANVFCDNQSVVTNSSLPQSTLSKKHNAICYHKIRELVAAEIIRVGKEDGGNNMADLFTKLLPAPKRRQLLSYITY